MKQCIFHYPHPIVDKPGIGSALRPNRMRAAFESIGYQVEEISGYSRERKQKIAQIKRNIRAGVRYDFVYSESVNIPTPLSDEDHIPRRPFLDFAFFRLCRKNGIPVGLFYRDKHWQFPVYRDHVSPWKQMITLPLFRWDLCMYRKYVDILYVPSRQMGALISHGNIVPLPPGGEAHPDVLGAQKVRQERLRIFYVGNVLGAYDVTAFCKAVYETEGVYLTICTPRDSWETAKHKYEAYLCDRIQIVHKSSAELQPYYLEADLFCCCVEENAYSRLAMPIKTFESISYGVPVMITEGIAAEELIAAEDCGWVVPNDSNAYAALLTRLRDNPEEIQRKMRNTVAIAPNHTWESRAQQVAKELTNLK